MHWIYFILQAEKSYTVVILNQFTSELPRALKTVIPTGNFENFNLSLEIFHFSEKYFNNLTNSMKNRMNLSNMFTN